MTARTANISKRVSLRWPPEAPFESTDTVSLSVGGWYVDLRVDNETGKMEWIMAGERIVEGEDPPIVLFTHAIDSLGLFETADRGTFEELPNGDDLERGKMPRLDLPDTPIREYEEVWRKISLPETAPRGIGCSWILESEDTTSDGEDLKTALSRIGEKEEVRIVKTFLGRVPGYFIALRQEQCYKKEKKGGGDGERVIRKRGGEVCGRREEWDSDAATGIKLKYVGGDGAGNLPSLVELGDKLKFEGEGEGSWKIPGEAVSVGGGKYVVRAFEAHPQSP